MREPTFAVDCAKRTSPADLWKALGQSLGVCIFDSTLRALGDEERARFRAEADVRNSRGLWYLLLLANLAFPPFTVVDYVISMERFSTLLPWRLAFFVGSGLLLGLYSFLLSRGFVNRIVMWWFGTITVIGSFAMLDLVIHVTQSTFYGAFGMAMVIMGTAAIMELKIVHSLIAGSFGLATIAPVSSSPADWVVAPAIVGVGVIIASVSSEIAARLRVAEFVAQHALKAERDRSSSLLRNTLPEPIADELERTGSVEPRDYSDASVMFIDIVGFTESSARVSSRVLVEELNQLFAGIDAIVEQAGLLKLKTIGDAYMTVAGLFESNRRTHLERTIRAAFAIQRFVKNHRSRLGVLDVRIGVHAGPLTAGVIGRERFAFDVWGDTVNLASRLEHASKPGMINMTTAVYARIASTFAGETRGRIEVKGKGLVHMTFAQDLRPQAAATSSR